MKLRIQNNTLRLRLTRSELARFERTGKVTAITEFGAAPSQRLVYVLQSSDDSPNLGARYAHGSITVTMPLAVAKQWIKDDQIGIEAEQTLGNNGSLKIIVEKDLTCIVKVADEENADTFSCPNEGG